MLRADDGHVLPAQPDLPPAFDLVAEIAWSGSPLLCVVYADDDGRTVHAIVNTSHDRLGYEHAAFHAERDRVTSPHACYADGACDYDPTARRGPECVPSRRAER